MRIYGLKTCDTCRKARKALPEAEFVDLREQEMPDGLLQKALETFGDQLVNRRSTTWRGLSETERETPALALLKAHKALMKRPLIEADGALYLGWDAKVQSTLGI